MDWIKFAYLILLICLPYIPYKLLQKNRGLVDISVKNASQLAFAFIFSMLMLLREVSIEHIRINPILIFILTFLVFLWFVAPRLLPMIGSYPSKALQPPSKLALISGHFPLQILKFVEVIFQEVFFLYLLTVVMSDLSTSDKILYFTVINFIIHAINILFVKHPVVLWITVMSIPMGVLFSYLIIDGFVMVTTMIHLSFYLLLIAYFWTNRKYS